MIFAALVAFGFVISASPALADQDAFSRPMAGLSSEDIARFERGRQLFRKLWTPGEGLGPRYNARGCQRCHRRDGRGHAPDGPGDTATSLVLNMVHADYGPQFHDFGVAVGDRDGLFDVVWDHVQVKLDDGTRIGLRKPRYLFSRLEAGAVDPSTPISPRVAPAIIGMGLIEAVSDDSLLARHDPDDKDGDGISGVARIIMRDGGSVYGRLGWKAEVADVRWQVAKALTRDMGLTTSMFPDGKPVNVNDRELDDLELYSAALDVPGRRAVGAEDARAGEAVFFRIGCAACHVPELQTRDDAPAPFAGRVIRLYSDLLLHDMGDELSDLGRPTAFSREWRTPPLWGIGLTKAVSGKTHFLHDGRARTLEEAILWHGGEGLSARKAYAALRRDDRSALIAFLQSL